MITVVSMAQNLSYAVPGDLIVLDGRLAVVAGAHPRVPARRFERTTKIDVAIASTLCDGQSIGASQLHGEGVILVELVERH